MGEGKALGVVVVGWAELEGIELGWGWGYSWVLEFGDADLGIRVERWWWCGGWVLGDGWGEWGGGVEGGGGECGVFTFREAGYEG